jgi:predicted transcriptional regulator
MLAVELVERDGLTVYAASKKMGINQSAVHRAIKRRADKNICPHCNQVIKTP